MAGGITLGELARRLGRDKGALSRAAKNGRIPRNPDGTFNLAKVRRALEEKTDPARRKPLPEGLPSEATPATATSRRRQRSDPPEVAGAGAEEAPADETSLIPRSPPARR
jgi:hypothetical protein